MFEKMTTIDKLAAALSIIIIGLSQIGCKEITAAEINEIEKQALEHAGRQSCVTGNVSLINYGNENDSASGELGDGEEEASNALDSLKGVALVVDLRIGKATAGRENDLACLNFQLSAARIASLKAALQGVTICPAKNFGTESHEGFETDLSASAFPDRQVSNWTKIRAQLEGVIQDMEDADCSPLSSVPANLTQDLNALLGRSLQDAK